MEDTDTITEVGEDTTGTKGPAAAGWADAEREVAEQLVGKAQQKGLDPNGPNGVLADLVFRDCGRLMGFDLHRCRTSWNTTKHAGPM